MKIAFFMLALLVLWFAWWSTAKADRENPRDGDKFICLTSDSYACEILRMSYIQNQSTKREIINRLVDDRAVIQESILRLHERIKRLEYKLEVSNNEEQD
jgi:hypothetical protein